MIAKLRSCALTVFLPALGLSLTPCAYADALTLSITFQGTTLRDLSVQTFQETASLTTQQLDACGEPDNNLCLTR